MSLSRSAIKRKTALKRVPVPRRDREARARATKTIRRQRDTGPTPVQRRAVAERANWCCELCGTQLGDPGHPPRWYEAHSFHHRRPRAMGGTTRVETNEPPNLLLLCGSATTPGGCHQRVESDRAAARAAGWLLTQTQDPATVPVDITAGAGLVLLTPDGRYERTHP